MDAFLPYSLPFRPAQELEKLAELEVQQLRARRSVRQFSSEPVPREVIENIIQCAGLAPSGANQQPWTFCAISSPELKHKIRIAAEEEEYAFYNGRAPKEWLKDLAPLGTDWHKPFLEDAPWLIVVFKQTYGEVNGTKHKHYYAQESVGIASGFLIQAIHRVGLCTLTHTPSPMNFLSTLLDRPKNETPFLLLPVGYPAPNAQVPSITKKPLEEIAVFY